MSLAEHQLHQQSFHTIIHNMSMNTKRLTISLPSHLYDQLMSSFGRGEVSKFISEATEKQLLQKKLEDKVDPVKDFLNLKEEFDFPKLTDKQIKEAISKGRT